MKTLDEIIADRRSVRDYQDKTVEKEKIELLIEAARLAPSACNKQPWVFAIAHSPKAKKAVFEKGLGELFVSNSWAKTAPVIIVVCSKRELLIHNIAEKIQGVDYHLIDIGIACQNLVLKAQEMGLGTCYIGWFNGKKILKALELPSAYKVECLITLGYPQEKEIKRTPRKNIEEIMLWK
jgi:nitroreductase